VGREPRAEQRLERARVACVQVGRTGRHTEQGWHVVSAPFAGGVTIALWPGIVQGGSTAGKPEGIAIGVVSSAVFVAVPKLPARRVAGRGPRAEYQVTVSVKPSPRHDWHAPQP